MPQADASPRTLQSGSPAEGFAERLFMKIKSAAAAVGRRHLSNKVHLDWLRNISLQKEESMRKAPLILALIATLGLATVAAPSPAEARHGFFPGLAGGLIAGAVFGGLASSAYAYGPYGYYGGYAPAYYGGYAGYYDEPVVRVVRYRRVVRPAFAY